jgi:hypothetical protein
MKKVSTFQKGKILFNIIESLKSIENKYFIYINEYESEMLLKIAKKSGVHISGSCEAGMIDISEDISIIYDWEEHNLYKKINNIKNNPNNRKKLPFIDFENIPVSEELKKATKDFEEKNIPSSGPCKTLIGEIFRAIQRVQYRAYNDGDLPWNVASPSFMSYIFIKSQIDKLNYSSSSYNEESGDHEFEFTDEFLKEHNWDGKISDMIEDELAMGLNFTKYQLIDLLLNGKIEDVSNRFDSRDYTTLERDSMYY